MTRAYFWRLFGNLHITEEDKKLLDTNEDFRGERRKVRQLYVNDFEQQAPATQGWNSERAHSGQHSLKVGQQQQLTDKIIFTPPTITEEWLRVSARFFALQKEWDKWRMCQLTVEFRQGEAVVKRNMIRIFRVYDQGSWQEVFIDVSIPDRDFDNIAVYLDNAGGNKEVFMDDLQIEAFVE